MPANPTLRRVKRAAHAVRSARDEYRAAVLEAREGGETFAAIGGAAGKTKQAVAEYVARVAVSQSESTTDERTQ